MIITCLDCGIRHETTEGKHTCGVVAIKIRSGDIVIFKDQSNNHIENTLYGGKVALLQGAHILIEHTDGIYRMWKTDELKKLTMEDLTTPNISII